MLNSLRSRVAQFTAAAIAARGQFGKALLPPVIRHTRNGQQQPAVNMYYATRAARLAARSRQYPYSSTRQNRRFVRNHDSLPDGTIVTLKSSKRSKKEYAEWVHPDFPVRAYRGGYQ